MPEDELFDIRELVNREVSSERCLFSFFSNYAYAYICFLDHSHIIASVSD